MRHRALKLRQRRQLDSIDWQILRVLQCNGRITNVELAEKVNLSPSPCLSRVRLLEENEIIARYVAILSPAAVGLEVTVFVQVRLERQSQNNLSSFERAVAARPEVMECYLMTGSSDYLLRIVVSNLDEFRRFVTEFLAKVPGIGGIQSSIALKEVKYETALPID